MYHKNEPFRVAQYSSPLLKKNGNHLGGTQVPRPTRPTHPDLTRPTVSKPSTAMGSSELKPHIAEVTRAVVNRHGRIQVPPYLEDHPR